MLNRTLLLALSVPLSALAASCAGEELPGGPGVSVFDAGPDVAPARTLRLDPPAVALEASFGGAKPSAQVRVLGRTSGGPEVDVTAECRFSVAAPAVASVSPAGLLSAQGIGGRTVVEARWGDAVASAPLTVKLVGDVFSTGTDASTKAAFEAATPDPDAGNRPALEYPEDGVVLPGNLPPIQVQFTQVADNAQYRLRFVSPDVLDLTVYTASREPLLGAPEWGAILASAPDAATQLVVEAVGPSKKLRKSAPRTLTVTADRIDDSAVYVWRSSTGSFRVLDIARGTDVALPNDSPALAAGQPCAGCHRISRDGKRFAYTSFPSPSFQFGTLAYDDSKKTFAAKIAPAAGSAGTYATFNPAEGTTRPAMLLSVPDSVPQNTAGIVRLAMVDPDNGQPVDSNVASLAAGLTGDVGASPSLLMPDWSPAGDFVVFAAHDASKNYVRLLGDDVVLGSIVEASVGYDAAKRSFTFGAPRVIVKAPPGASGDTGQNNVLPAISPDGAAVAFTRAAGYWSIKTQQSFVNLSGQVAVVRRSDGVIMELHRGSNGPGTTWSSTWPQWAPTMGQRYAWLAYASERPYGHVLTTATPQNARCNLVQGQKQCKQLWVTAIDRAKLASGVDDPSAPAFWIPGQSTDSQYVSPQWTKAVLPPPR